MPQVPARRPAASSAARHSLYTVAILLALVSITVVITSCAHPPRPASSPVSMDDATISARVKTALLNDPNVSALHMDVSTTGGVVTLTGTARSRDEEQKAVEVARKVPGVRDVKSSLQIQGGPTD